MPRSVGWPLPAAWTSFWAADFEKMADMQLYRASDMLHKHRKAIEDHLFARALDLFDLEPYRSRSMIYPTIKLTHTTDNATIPFTALPRRTHRGKVQGRRPCSISSAHFRIDKRYWLRARGRRKPFEPERALALQTASGSDVEVYREEADDAALLPIPVPHGEGRGQGEAESGLRCTAKYKVPLCSRK